MSNGTMVVKIHLLNGETISHPCMIKTELQFNGVRDMLKEYYKMRIPIKEEVSLAKGKGLLLKLTGQYTYKQIQEMKAELDID